MIYGFLDSKVVNAEEYLIDYSIRTGQSVNISTDLLNIPITFDGSDINAFILDITNNNELVLQLVLRIKEKFDNSSNCYKTSYIRELLNSTHFLNRFNTKFINHIKQTKIHTENYITTDKLWLLSHEEINLADTIFLNRNKTCKSFDAFKHIELKSYSKTLLNLNQQNCYGWRLRSAYSGTNYESNSISVGYVSDYGNVYSDNANDTNHGALLPACIID